MSRVFFESVTLGALAVMVAIGVVFWAIGAGNRRHGLTGQTELYTAGATVPGGRG